MISIKQRPKEVKARIIPGHWESDLIIGKWKRSALGTIVERTTRTVILVPLKNKGAELVSLWDGKITSSNEAILNLRSRQGDNKAQAVY